jgi:hypothetical protein
VLAEAERALGFVQISFANHNSTLQIKTFPERFAPSIKFSTILDRISSLMCVIFRIAKKLLSVQRE